MNNWYSPEQILVVVTLLSLLLVTVKFLMVLSWRQRVYFKQKLVRSFFFYDVDKISNHTEVRLKKYYRISNKVNSLFYTTISLVMIAYTVLTILM